MKTLRSVCQTPEAASAPRARRTAPATEAARPGRPRNPALDAAILQAARAVLAEVSCGGFTMEGVAARAGVAKQTLYRRWASRGELLIDLYYQDETAAAPESVGAAPEAQHLTQATPLPDAVQADDFPTAFAAFLDLNLRRLYHPWHQNLLRGLAVAAQTDAELRQVLLARITRPRLELGRSIMRRARLAGVLRPGVEEDLVLEFALGSIWFALLFGEEPITPALQQRILNGVLAMALREPAADAP